MKKWMKTALVLAAAVCLSVAAAFTALAAQTFQITASIGSCLIGSGQNTVDISLSSNGDTTGTDGKIYLFELRPYESEIGSRTDYVSSVGAGETRTVSIPLNKGTAQDRLYSRLRAKAPAAPGSVFGNFPLFYVQMFPYFIMPP